MFYSLEPLCVLFAFLLQLGSSFVLTQTLGCFDPNEVVTSLRKQFTFLLVLFSCDLSTLLWLVPSLKDNDKSRALNFFVSSLPSSLLFELADARWQLSLLLRGAGRVWCTSTLMHTIYRKLIGLTIREGKKGEGIIIIFFFFVYFLEFLKFFFASAKHSIFYGFLRIKYVMSIFFSVWIF